MAEVCEKCNATVEIGDWPYCPHESIYTLNARRFDPVLYFENKAGERIIPPGHDIPAPEGYVAKTASTLPEVRSLTKHLDRQSKENFYKYHNQRIKLRRENVDRNLEFALRAREKMSDPLAKKVTDYAISRMRDQRRDVVPDFKPSGHFEAFE